MDTRPDHRSLSWSTDVYLGAIIPPWGRYGASMFAVSLRILRPELVTRKGCQLAPTEARPSVSCGATATSPMHVIGEIKRTTGSPYRLAMGMQRATGLGYRSARAWQPARLTEGPKSVGHLAPTPDSPEIRASPLSEGLEVEEVEGTSPLN